MNSNVIGLMFELELVSLLGVTENNFVDSYIGNKKINKQLTALICVHLVII